MQVSLLRALRATIRADSDPGRQTLFANLGRSSLAVRLVAGLHERLGKTLASSVLVSCYGLKSFLGIAAPARSRARILTVAVHANARRQVERVATWFDSDETSRVQIGTSVLLRPSAIRQLFSLLRTRRDWVRALRVVHGVNMRSDFLVSCRTASTLACYARAKSILGSQRPSVVVVSSDTNPEEIGFASAARTFGIPTVFIAHAYPSPFSPPLDFSLSILEGEAAVDARRQKGTIKGEVFLAGLEGESAPLDVTRFEKPDPVIGIFAPKAVSWPKLAEVVLDCRRRFRPRQVLIRWHPSMLEPPQLQRILADCSGVEGTSGAATLREVVDRCDWIIADPNSNVHLPVLKLGVPTVAIRNLGVYSEERADIYGFHAHGIVFPPVESIGELQTAALVAFFSQGWQERFTRYDASYLRPRRVIEREARHAIQRLIDGDLNPPSTSA